MIVSHEPSFNKAAQNALEFDRKEVLAIISTVKTKALEQKASIDWNNAVEPISDFYNSTSKTNWRDEFMPALEAIYGDTEKYWGLQMGVAFNVRNIEGEYALDQYTLKFSNHIARTNSDSIKTILQYGYRDGSTIEQMTSRINDLYSGWSDWRGELIARTETTRAANDGARKLYKRWGVEQKEWLSTFDDRTRDTHKALDGQIVDIDEYFESPSGAKLMQPGDSSAPLSETAACRCTTLPVIDNKEKIQDNIENVVIPEITYTDYKANPENFGKFESKWEKIVDKYSEEMKDAFNLYTSGGYGHNSYLRGLFGEREERLVNMSNEMDKDFKKKLGENLILRRGVRQNAIDNLGLTDLWNSKGLTVQDKGYMSTSAFSGAFEAPYLFEIMADKNVKGVYLDSISDFSRAIMGDEHAEYEVLLPRNTKLEIIDVVETNQRFMGKNVIKIITRVVV